jgi:hypothetical protein
MPTADGSSDARSYSAHASVWAALVTIGLLVPYFVISFFLFAERKQLQGVRVHAPDPAHLLQTS